MSPNPIRYDIPGGAAVFASDAMAQVLSFVQRVAQSSAAVLISGESGAGKEVIARAIHHYSLRGGRPWVDVNCAAIPENLLESELFGYEKGAFSGAQSSKPGFFELADRGTLFLDEIGDLDPRLQVKLLRVLDGAPFYRVGGIRKVSVDVRLISATNQNLRDLAADGRFRFDLLQRLSQIRVSVPALRERREDIVALADHYLRLENPHLRFSREVLQRFCEYRWPGNVRELRNVVTHASIICTGDEVLLEDLPEELRGAAAGERAYDNLDQLERCAIFRALQASDGRQQAAASRLGISKRTLQRRIRAYRLAGSAAEAPVMPLSASAR